MTNRPHRPGPILRIPARRGALAVLAVAGLTLAAAGPGSGDPASAPASVPGTAPLASPATVVALPGTAVSVTLLTGDRVWVTTGPDGASVDRVEAAPRHDGTSVGFQTLTRGGDVYVVPSDASDGVASGRLDLDLFNVALLAEHGIGTGGPLPLIVQHVGAARRAAADALPGTTAGPSLDSIDATAVTVDPAATADFWAAIDADAGTARGTAAPARIWLDGPVEVALDESVAQVGAPQAWAAGYDGDGVTVAVLDTGADATHPDLAGRIVASRSFVPGQDEVTDRHGHGTHVASTVAGTGAGSDGRYRGVAPGAELVIGKVLGDGGAGSDSMIIAGMEWAVEQGADIVSMSLGGDPTDGTDPMSQAVDRLSAESEALFVIAAGNSGPEAGTVGAPGAAQSALTVGAVDKSDLMAGFSSRGPRVGDVGLKPDIVAPGVAIAAARAAGTSMGDPVDERYTAANGTSMATPHVAGAAAIVAQRHPDWDGEQLKAALTSTTTDVGGTAFHQGAGRLDVARAATQDVVASESIFVGHLPYPQTAPVTRPVGFVNAGAEPVTLDLSATIATAAGAAAPAGMIAVAPARLTVPAGGTATAEVTVDATVGEPVGLYQGRVRATGDGVELTTVVGVFVEPEKFDLTVEAVAPAGATDVRVGNWLVIRNDGWIDFTDNTVRLPGVPRATATLPRGTYTVAVQVSWRDSAGELHVGMPLDPQARLESDATVTFDLAAAPELTATTPVPTESYDARLSYLRTGPGGAWTLTSEVQGEYGQQHYRITPTALVEAGALEVGAQLLLGPQLVTMRTLGAQARALHPLYRSADVTDPKLPVARPHPVVDGGTGTPAELAGIEAADALVLLTPGDLCTPGCGAALADRIADAADAGAAGVLVAGATARVSLGTRPYALPVLTLPPAEGAALRAELEHRPVRVRIGGETGVPSLYLLNFTETGAVPESLSYAVADDELALVEHALHASAADAGQPRRLAWSLAGAVIRLPYVTTPRTLGVRVGPADPDVLHALDLQDADPSDGGLYLESGDHVFGEPRTYEVAWNAGPIVPGPAEPDRPAGMAPAMRVCSGCRMGDVFLPFMYLSAPGGHEASYLGVVEGGALAPSSHVCRPDDPGKPPSWPPRLQCTVRLYGADGAEIPQRLVDDTPMIPPLGRAGEEEDR
jgi:subtilisin family serine protease